MIASREREPVAARRGAASCGVGVEAGARSRAHASEHLDIGGSADVAELVEASGAFACGRDELARVKDA